MEGAATDRLREVIAETTRAMSKNLADSLYRDLPAWCGPQTPPKPLTEAEIAVQKTKNELADKLIELASALKGYDVTGGDW